MLDYGKVKGYLPDSVFDAIENCALKYKINTKLRLAHFLAQCKHESANFTRTEENLNYSAKNLLGTFPKYFSEETANEYAHNAIRIASRVYANRMGNGNVSTQDGWMYRGRGYIQLTGKDNYGKFDLIVPENIVANPDLVATKYPLLSAAWFWGSRKLNEIADVGSTENDVAAITRKINGGMNGIADRVEWFNKLYGLLKDKENE